MISELFVDAVSVAYVVLVLREVMRWLNSTGSEKDENWRH